jgi:protein PhnA
MSDDVNWDDVVWDEEKGEFVPANPVGGDDDDDGLEVLPTYDSNQVELKTGDTCVLIRDLDVKGSAIKLKRGHKVKVKVGDDPELVECKIGKSEIFLKTCFLKKI